MNSLNFYSLQNMIGCMKLWIRWMGDVACMEEIRKAYITVDGKPEGKGPLVDLGIVGRIILRLILWKYEVRLQTEFIWLWVRSIGGFL